MEDTHKKIEAVLFTTGRFLTIDEISNLSNIASQGIVKDALQELTKEYLSKDSALEIVQQGETFKLNLRKEYLYITSKLLSDSDLDRPAQETLALIAYKTPALQSEIVNMRGTTAYEHIQKLKELEFVTSEKSGRTRLLKTTGKFYEYFDVIDSQLKQKFIDATSKKQETIPALEQKENETQT